MMNFEFMPFFKSLWVGMPFWWLLIIAVIAMLLQLLTRGFRRPHGRVQSPLEILRERFARGEISREEFEDRKKDLV